MLKKLESLYLMNKSKNIYIGAMSGTSYDAIDVSIIKIEKNITLESFYSKQIQT